MNNKETILRFQKNVDSTSNKMVIPKFFVNKWGRTFIVEVDNDEGIIVIKPIKKGE